MEAVDGKESGGLFTTILPPRLEDAGLEDCALPADSIQEAFMKAAFAVKSRAATLFRSDKEDDEPSCVQDSWPEDGRGAGDDVTWLSPPSEVSADVVVKGSDPGVPGCCVEGEVGDDWSEKRGGDEVVIGGDGPEAVAGKGCVEDGLKGLKIGEKDGEKDEDEEEEEGENNEKPILVEGSV